MNELGFYTLAGAPRSPRDLVTEVREAEELGLGRRSSASGSTSRRPRRCRGCRRRVGADRDRHRGDEPQPRHPMVTAACAMTMHTLTGGRFSLGLGRGIAPMFDAYGLQRITTAQLEDFVGLMRRVWRGEVVIGHDGPAGSYPVLAMSGIEPAHIPMTFTAFGPRSLRARRPLLRRRGAAHVLHRRDDRALCPHGQAGRRASGPRSRRGQVWSCFATIGDHLPEDVRLKKTVGRMATYLQGYGDLMVSTNRWDPAVLTRFRADPFVAGFRGRSISWRRPSNRARRHPHPEEWLASAAHGSPAQCVDAVRHQFDLGCGAVILHGGSGQLAPVVEEYRRRGPQAASISSSPIRAARGVRADDRARRGTVGTPLCHTSQSSTSPSSGPRSITSRTPSSCAPSNPSTPSRRPRRASSGGSRPTRAPRATRRSRGWRTRW
ncbi:MAG: LLM class flavin-dependent oxidoreductase [Ilumatobacteraceae bacterium]